MTACPLICQLVKYQAPVSIWTISGQLWTAVLAPVRTA